MDFFNIFPTMAGEISRLAPGDFLTIATLAILEGILSVDNALVLAILVRQLPKEQQAKAMTLGLGGAFVFRLLALVFAAHLMELMVFKLVGGGYLLYLSMKHLFFYREEAYHQTRKASASLWRTVLVVELTDLAFSIDSITAAVAMTDKLSVVWIGGILGIVCLRFASKFFIYLLERLPRLEDLAYQIIFFVGTKLTLEGFHIEIGQETFWLVMGVIAVLGASLVYKDWSQRHQHRHYEDELLTRVKAGNITLEELMKKPNVPVSVIAWFAEQGCLKLPEAPAEAQGGSGETEGKGSVS